MLGFTGHEHMYELDLIHMKGRVYDPTIGRFLQADVIVQSPVQILSYNRYAYVWNNPLASIDPTGYYCQSAACATEAANDYDNEVPATENNAKSKRDRNSETKNQAARLSNAQGTNDPLARQEEFLFQLFGDDAQKARLERIRQLSEESRISINPFKLIAKELPKWWFSSETEDLRNGLDMTFEGVSIPYKVLRLPLDFNSYAIAADHAVDGELAEAFIELSEVFIGKGTVKQLEAFDIKKDMFVNGVGVVTSNVGGKMLEKDCYVCK